jgi:nitrite reductase/ring-hydroxylating ferredoxin subunit
LDHGKINLQAKTVSCPLHQSVFRFDTGEQVAGPECGKLKVAITSTITVSNH